MSVGNERNEEMSDIHKLKINKELVLDFYLTFSRFEYALKNSGFARGNENFVEPNWNEFALSLKDKFNKNANKILLEEASYFLEEPPLQQVLLRDGLAWSGGIMPDHLSEIEKLLRLVNRVRNNLFHGGKHSMEDFEQKERTEHLLKCCLIILEECLKLALDVKTKFDEAVL